MGSDRNSHNGSEQFVVNDEVAFSIVNGNFGEYEQEMKNGIWALLVKDCKHIFQQFISFDEISICLIENPYILSHVWINGLMYKASNKITLEPKELFYGCDIEGFTEITYDC